MAFTMHDPAALQRYIERTRELLGITPDGRAQALLLQMIRDAERQLAKRSRGGEGIKCKAANVPSLDEAPSPLGGTAIKLHQMTDAQLNTGIRDASELASRLVDMHAAAAHLLRAGIELAISELVLRSEQSSPSRDADGLGARAALAATEATRSIALK